MTLSENLQPGPWSKFTGTKEDYHRQMWLAIDAQELERDLVLKDREIDRLNGPIHTTLWGTHVFPTENEARLCWTLLQICLLGTADVTKHHEYPPDVQARRERRRQAEHIRSYQERWRHTPRALTEIYTGEIS